MIEYLPDSHIDATLDERLRHLLRMCFTKPRDIVFETQRYFREPYPHHWVIRDENGRLVAHIGVHEKTVKTQAASYRIGGICEVCVHPDHRGHGYVKSMLSDIHRWLSGQEFDFAMLFGDQRVYESSGYVRIAPLLHGSDEEGWKPVQPLIRALSATAWPDSGAVLPGPVF